MLRVKRRPPPFSPPSGPTQWLFQEPPAKSNFLAVNGEVTHVSNVNVQKLPDGSLHMLATAWPDANNMNKTCQKTLGETTLRGTLKSN